MLPCTLDQAPLRARGAAAAHRLPVGPGKFASDLTLKKDGSFVLDYRGEIVLQLPPDDECAEPWSDAKAHCTDGQEQRTRCHAPHAEIADAESRARQSDRAKKRKECRADGQDVRPARARRRIKPRLRRQAEKYAGWRSVTYRGKGVFDVDYHFDGRATQDFLFPALPDNDFIVPFIAIRRRADGSVLVTAPAFTGGAGPLAARAGAAAAGEMKAGPVSRARAASRSSPTAKS